MFTSPARVVRLTRLRYWRDRRALTQRELAERSGITVAALSRLELLKAQPRPATTRALAAALNVEPASLMGPPDQPV